ncbi:prepilin peptidase [Alkalibacter rhizosphaerae]|uniref:Prepilin leader peptidase/N-methyltransferase n=2 Tax=Alkalibacter rhizosphaerae TaxID=2815577 RepID=A0A975AIF3_9FIRM|nr:prepilin peptidase [Alkalibacter rhizosphaerae]
MFVVFVFGLLIGSFLNVVIYRLPEGQSIASPPSHCPQCGTPLKPVDLVPVLSWLMLGGKCRYCKAKVPARYALVELLTGFLFLFTYLQFGLSWMLLVHLVFVAVLIAMTFIDLDHQIIPDELNVFLLVIFVVANLALGFIPWKDAVFGALAGFIPLFLLVLLTGGAGMGMGDVKLMFVLGLYLGLWHTLLTLFLSFIYGGFFGVVLLATKIKKRKDAIPFGPWIALAALTTLYFGSNLISWYLGFLL